MGERQASQRCASFQVTQLELAAHLRNPAAVLPPTDIEDRRLAIYRDLIFNNIEGFLSGGFPILHSLLEESEWRALVRGFIAHHDCQTPYFLEISQEFLNYLQAQQPSPVARLPFAQELAHYEWVELALDVSTQTFPTDAQSDDGNLLDDHPLVSPLAWRLCYEYPVHRIGSGFQPEHPPEMPTHLIVYRDRQEQVKFLESNAITVRLLQLLEEGSYTGRAALLQLADEMGHADIEFIVASGQAILQELQDLSIVCGFKTQAVTKVK